MFFSDSLYNKLKFLAQIALPALATLYFTLAGIWDLPSAGAIVGTIVAFDTFLGVLLGISTAAYNTSDKKYDGRVIVNHDLRSGKKIVTLHVNDDPEKIEEKDELSFKVEAPPPPVDQ